MRKSSIVRIILVNLFPERISIYYKFTINKNWVLKSKTI